MSSSLSSMLSTTELLNSYTYLAGNRADSLAIIDYELESPLGSPLGSSTPSPPAAHCGFKASVDSRESLDLVNSLLLMRHYITDQKVKKSIPRSIANPFDANCPSPSKPLSSALPPVPKGRPFSFSLNARFYIHSSINDLCCHLKNKLSFTYKVENSTHHHEISKNVVRNHKNIIFNLPKSSNIYAKLCDAFKIKKFKFVKVVRDVHGRLMKIESVTPPSDQLVNSNWIKSNICYPRYKSNMKMHLVISDYSNEESIYFNESFKAIDLGLSSNSNRIVKLVTSF